ncbi:MAG: protein-glutamate O-methyltransferase [Rhodospirillales bacterium]|nr:protein-glutamate O-methyltransferase [Rhodospirillales bacterium]
MQISSANPVPPLPTHAQSARETQSAPVERPADSQRPADSHLSGVTRSRLDPATQLAAHESNQNRRSDKSDLSEEEQAQVQTLRRRDLEVRRHERAHAAAGGGVAGMPVYEYVRGPDGKQYAVGGEVAINAGAAATPEATIQKMDQVIRAALAPADPSAQDIRVASQARQAKAEAVAQKNAEEREETESSDKPRFFDIVV